MILARELNNFLDQANNSNDQADLGVFVIFAAFVIHTHVAGELHGLFVGSRFRDVIGSPTYSTGEIANLDLRLADEIALDAPLQGVADAGRKTDIEDIERVGMSDGAELDRGRIDEGVGPGEFKAVEAFAKGQQPGLPDESEVDRVVDGELDRIAPGQIDHIDPGA